MADRGAVAKKYISELTNAYAERHGRYTQLMIRVAKFIVKLREEKQRRLQDIARQRDPFLRHRHHTVPVAKNTYLPMSCKSCSVDKASAKTGD